MIMLFCKIGMNKGAIKALTSYSIGFESGIIISILSWQWYYGLYHTYLVFNAPETVRF